MRRAIATAVAVCAMAGCGWYTNFPANIQIKGVSPSTVTVDYTTTTSSGTSTTTTNYTQPTLTLEGAPGSVGATYTDLTITYHSAATASVSGLGPLLSGITPNPVYSGQTIRVDSSALRSNYAQGTQDMVGLAPGANTSQQQPLIIGIASASVPVISADVIKYGNPASNNASQIVADVTLDGMDDAHFQTHLDVQIPISFVSDTL